MKRKTINYNYKNKYNYNISCGIGESQTLSFFVTADIECNPSQSLENKKCFEIKLPHWLQLLLSHESWCNPPANDIDSGPALPLIYQWYQNIKINNLMFLTNGTNSNRHRTPNHQSWCKTVLNVESCSCDWRRCSGHPGIYHFWTPRPPPHWPPPLDLLSNWRVWGEGGRGVRLCNQLMLALCIRLLLLLTYISPTSLMMVPLGKVNSGLRKMCWLSGWVILLSWHSFEICF